MVMQGGAGKSEPRRDREHFPPLVAVRAVLRRMPPLSGAPVRIENAPGLRDRHGAVHAGSFVGERRIAFDCTAEEFPRIFVHEMFHFAWVRLGNPARISYEALLRREMREGAHGELGWSAERRKNSLRPADIRLRARRWREYCCESFCDSGAWLYSGVAQHEEYTLARRFRNRRRAWFIEQIGIDRLSV